MLYTTSQPCSCAGKLACGPGGAARRAGCRAHWQAGPAGQPECHHCHGGGAGPAVPASASRAAAGPAGAAADSEPATGNFKLNESS